MAEVSWWRATPVDEDGDYPSTDFEVDSARAAAERLARVVAVSDNSPFCWVRVRVVQLDGKDGAPVGEETWWAAEAELKWTTQAQQMEAPRG